MNSVYVAAFACQGIALPKDTPDIDILHAPNDGTSTVLTLKPDERLYLIDRSSAIKTLLLSAIFQSQGGDFESRLRGEIVRIINERNQVTATAPTLVVMIEQDTLLSIPEEGGVHHEDFSVYIDSIDTSDIAGHAQGLIKQVLSSLMLSVQSHATFDEVARGLYLIGQDNKIIYPYRISGSATLTGARHFPVEAVPVVSQVFNGLKEGNFSAVCKLLPSAMERKGDPLRAYIAAWTALEIFIQKTFPIYEEKWLSEATKNRGATEEGFINRLREVMSGKYGLAGQFSVISMMLDEVDTDDNVALFKKIKKQRGQFIHEGFGERKDFMTYEITGLLRKLLRKHIVAHSLKG